MTEHTQILENSMCLQLLHLIAANKVTLLLTFMQTHKTQTSAFRKAPVVSTVNRLSLKMTQPNDISAHTAKLPMSTDDLLFSILKQPGGHADVPAHGHTMVEYSTS